MLPFSFHSPIPASRESLSTAKSCSLRWETPRCIGKGLTNFKAFIVEFCSSLPQILSYEVDGRRMFTPCDATLHECTHKRGERLRNAVRCKCNALIVNLTSNFW